MGIGTALSNGVLGLNAQGSKLQNLSDNIANSDTTAYKRAATEFSSLVVDGEGMGVEAATRREVSSRGVQENTGKDTDFSISGDGFFMVDDGSTGQPEFATRAGSFSPDADGFLRNSQGYYLYGTNLADLPAGAAEPTLTTNNLEAINVTGINYRPEPTQNVSFAGNLPDGATAGETFETTVEYYDEKGNSQTLTLTFTATAAANEFDLTVGDSAGGAVDGSSLTIQFNDGSGTEEAGSLSALAGGGAGMTLNGDGSVDLDVGGTMPDINLNLGTPANAAAGVLGMDGATLLGGDYQVTEIDADGSAFSRLDGVVMEEGGLLTAVFENGARQAVSRIPVATVVNPDQMFGMDGQAFKSTSDSGPLVMKQAGSSGAGEITGGALEMSNVDLSNELTEMIQAQRNYQANATSVRTADDLLQEVVRLKQ